MPRLLSLLCDILGGLAEDVLVGGCGGVMSSSQLSGRCSLRIVSFG